MFSCQSETSDSDKMSVDGENTAAKLPSAFQSLSTPSSSTITKTVVSSATTVNQLYGYRSNFNVNEEKAKYEQQRQRNSPPPPPHQQNQRQPYHQQFHDKPQNNERFANNHRNNSLTDSVGGWCEVCERSFKTPQQLDRHLSEHEKCCFDGCQFEAHSSLLKKHIEAQHNSGLFQRIGTIETEEDIEKWREERRKRYPTRANIEARQLAQEQRMKRGERIVEPINRFGKNSDRRSANEGKFDRKEHNKSTAKDKKKRPRKRRNNNKPKNTADKQAQGTNSTAKSVEIIEKANTEVVRFAGISHMGATNESGSNVVQEKQNNALTALMGLYGDDATDDEDDCDAGPEEMAVAKYNDTHLESELSANLPAEKSHAENDIQKLSLTEANELSSGPSKMHCNSDDDEPPEVQSISHEPSEEDNRLNECKVAESENDRKRPNDQQTSKHEPQRKIPKKQSIFDMTKKIRYQNSLLEKLLQKDIRHERNVLLQCVRYVVENDFFGVGQPTKQIL